MGAMLQVQGVLASAHMCVSQRKVSPTVWDAHVATAGDPQPLLVEPRQL